MHAPRPVMLFATLFPSLLLSFAQAQVPDAEPQAPAVVPFPAFERVADLPLEAVEQGYAPLCGDVRVTVEGGVRRVTEATLDGCARLGLPISPAFPVNALLLAQAAGLGNFRGDLRDLYLASAVPIPQVDACALLQNTDAPTASDAATDAARPVRRFTLPENRRRGIELALLPEARQVECLEELERRDPGAFERAIFPVTDAVWFQELPLGAPISGTLTDPAVRSLVRQNPSPGTSRPVRIYSTDAPVSTLETAKKSGVRVYATPD